MKTQFVITVVLLFLVAIHSPATADTTLPEPPAAIAAVPAGGIDYKPIIIPWDLRNDKVWITSDRYEISKINGVQDVYNVEERIVLFVEGKSGQLEVDEANGFSLVATKFDLSRNVGTREEVNFDAESHSWVVRLLAPKDVTKEYKIKLSLFCKKSESACATTYGFGTQVDKTIPLQLR